MSDIASNFEWTLAGLAIIRRGKRPPGIKDFTIQRDGKDKWAIYHWQSKSAAAFCDGEGVAGFLALRALAVALVIERLAR